MRHPPVDPGRVCGRCATQVQSRPVSALAHSSSSDTSRGLCQPQTWATRARATPSASSRGPAMPRTPTEASGTATGTRSRSRDVHWGSRAASVTVVSDATVPVPTDNERKSSSTRRRSHSRESGAVTVLSSSAWSGWRCRRRSRSSRSATSRACSAAARAAAWSATLRVQPALPSRRSLTQLPTSMSGLIRPNSNMVGLSRTRHITTARTRGSAVAITGSFDPSRRVGGAGSRMSVTAAGGWMRGRRLTQRWPAPSGWVAASWPKGVRSTSVDDPTDR